MVVEEYRVIKVTPKGYWVASQYSPLWLSSEELIRRKYARWVSSTAHKRYCYPTMELAASSFKRRKEVQLSKLQYELNQVSYVVKNLDKVTADEKLYKGEGLNLGMPIEFDSLNFY